MARDSTETWLDAAYQRFAAGGLGAIRVEAIARDIGATKGSFYWHFENRQALINAVMERWEANETEQIIELANRGGTPRARITSLYEIVASRYGRRTGESSLYIEAAGENVDAVVARVSSRRIQYLAEVLEELGLARDEAVARSTIALAAVLGLQQLASVNGAMPADVSSATLTQTALTMSLGK